MEREYAESYQRLYQQHWWWRSRERLVLDVLRSLDLASRNRVLDVGCGGGWSFDVLRPYGQVFGVEVDASLVALAGDKAGQIYCGKFDRDYRPSERFSLILMLDVLEHLAEPIEALRYALELLEPGGRIVITLPAFEQFWTAHDELNHHYARYTKSSFRDVAKESGLDFERLEYFFHWTAPLKLAVRAKEWLLGASGKPPAVPARPINAGLIRLCRFEQWMTRRCKLPFGTSLLCVGGASPLTFAK